MPKEFDKCVKEGGKIRTMKNGQKICIKDNKVYPGHKVKKEQ